MRRFSTWTALLGALALSTIAGVAQQTPVDNVARVPGGTPSRSRRPSRLDRLIKSSVNYWTAMLGDVMAALAFLVLGLKWFAGSTVEAGVVVVVGCLSYGFLEYVVHRWVLHGPPSPARRSHAHHHAEPRALISTPLFLIMGGAWALWACLGFVLPAGVAALALFGLYAGYNYFGLLHHWEHQHGQAPANVSYFKQLERRHDLHHHRPAVNFGLSTTIWDRLFGTFQRP